MVGLESDFSAAATFGEVAGVFAFTGFDVVAFVDFARVVDFFVNSGISTSTGSEITFLGLPLFLTTSEDMLCVELFPRGNCGGCGGQEAQMGNFED